MKKGYKIILSLVALAIVFQIVGEYLINKDSPEELEYLLNSTRDNDSLVRKIGGYKSYELSYNYRLRDAKNNYPFDVTVFGQNAYLNFKGFSQFNHEKNMWLIIKVDTLFKKY